MEKLSTTIILEILGRPPEHIKEALTTLVLRLGSEKGVTLVNKKIHDPQPVKDSKTLFTTFAEVDLELDSLDTYLTVLFAYMPSHFELTYPEKLTLENNDLNDLANKILQRLHDYDAIAKNVLAERDIIIQKLQQLAPDVFKQLFQQTQQPTAEKQKKSEAKKISRKKVKKKS